MLDVDEEWNGRASLGLEGLVISSTRCGMHADKCSANPLGMGSVADDDRLYGMP